MADDGVDSSAGVGEEARVNIRGTNGLRFYVHANLNSTVVDFKSIVAQKCDIPAQQQRLIHKGHLMKDDKTLRSYGVEGDDTVYLVRVSAPADASKPTNAGSIVPPFGPSFFPELDQMRSTIINNHPMRDFISRHPQLWRRLHDPATLHWLMNGARNPEILREMMRNSDWISYILRQQEAGRTPGPENMINSPAPNTNPLPNPWASAATGSTHTNSGAFGNPIGNTSVHPSGGFNFSAELNFPDLERMMYYIVDPEESYEVNQDPEITITISNMLSNPQYLNQMLGFNPQLQTVLDSNPQIRDVMQSPEFIRRLATPVIVNELLISHRNLVSLASEGEAGTYTAARGLETLMDIFRRFAEYGTNNPTSRDHGPPEEQYAIQLSELEEMGFSDTQENIRALIATAGNVQSAVERLLGNPAS